MADEESDIHFSEQSVRRFSTEEMVACETCLRANAPTRTSCLYCGALLPVDATNASLRRPNLKPLEEWEQGFNVILCSAPPGAVSDDGLIETGALVRIDIAILKELIALSAPLPLARASSQDEANLLVSRLRPLGIRCIVVSDESLAVSSRPPRRARTIDWTDLSLTLWTTVDGAPTELSFGNIVLLVSGRVFTKRVEVEEQRGRITGRGDIVESRELVTDEYVIDIYPRDDDSDSGWRISAQNFDYSCLGERKGLLVRDNFTTLTSLLRERASHAAFDDDYQRVRHVLTAAWPLIERKEGQRIRRAKGGRLNTEAVTVVSNEAQFTRYSRLHWRMAQLSRKT